MSAQQFEIWLLWEVDAHTMVEFPVEKEYMSLQRGHHHHQWPDSCRYEFVYYIIPRPEERSGKDGTDPPFISVHLSLSQGPASSPADGLWF